MSENDTRQELRNEIVEQIDSCDEGTLIRIGEMLDSVEDDSDGKAMLFSEGITRQQFLAGLAAGGATLVSTSLATGLMAWLAGGEGGSSQSRAGESGRVDEAERTPCPI
jgi:hypothetical protein